MSKFFGTKWKLQPGGCAVTVFGSAFLAFGLYHVHNFSGVTEGGILGLTLLLDHWLGVSPAASGLVLNLLCYALGWKLLGGEFLGYSILAAASFSGAYRIFEQFPPLWPQLAELPLLASIVGAVFVGVGVGVCVRVGGAPGGDDALAMSISHLTKWKIQWVYLLSDFVVLALSLSYIPLKRIGFSVLTVILSGQLIGFLGTCPLPWRKREA